jgi:hypothetical protein
MKGRYITYEFATEVAKLIMEALETINLLD